MIRNAGFSQNTFVSRTAHTQKRKKLGFNGIIVEPELMRKGWQKLKAAGNSTRLLTKYKNTINVQGLETSEGDRIFILGCTDCTHIKDPRVKGFNVLILADRILGTCAFEINKGAKDIPILSNFGRQGIQRIQNSAFGMLVEGLLGRGTVCENHFIAQNTKVFSLEETASSLHTVLNGIIGRK